MNKLFRNINVKILNYLFITFLLGVLLGILVYILDNAFLDELMYFSVRPFHTLLFGSFYSVVHSFLVVYGLLFIILSILGISMLGSFLIYIVNIIYGVIGGYSYIYLINNYADNQTLFVILLVLIYIIIFIPSLIYYSYTSIVVSGKIRYSFLQGKKVVSTKNDYEKHIKLILVMFIVFIVYIIFMASVIGGIF